MSRDAASYPVVVSPDTCTDGSFCYVAGHPDLPGCAAHGRTIAEARERLADARTAYLKHLQATGQPVPPPNKSQPSVIEWDAADANDTAGDPSLHNAAA